MIVLLAGPIAAGKSTVGQRLTADSTRRYVSVRSALHETLGVTQLDRKELQTQGANLDRRTQGRWLAEYLEATGSECLVVDSLRTIRQSVPILNGPLPTFLVYLSAHESTRRARYVSSAITDPIKRSVPFDAAMAHPTELEVAKLATLADLDLETDDLSPAETAEAITAAMR